MAHDSHNRLSRLERLPSLLLRDVMVLLAVPDIRSLTAASPTFHRIYHGEGTYILRESLKQTLGYQTFLDAVTVHRAPPAALQHTGSLQSVLDHLAKYRRQMAGEPIPPLQRQELIAIAKRHWLKFLPLANIVQTAMTSWRPSHGFRQPDDDDDDREHAAHRPLSPTERARIVRAMYRFEIHSLLFFDERFWPGIEDEQTGDGVHFGVAERAVLFTTLYEPWEAEEVLCVDECVYPWLFRTAHSLGRWTGLTEDDLSHLNITSLVPSSRQPLDQWVPTAPRVQPLFDFGPSFVHQVNERSIEALRDGGLIRRLEECMFQAATQNGQFRTPFRRDRLDEWMLRGEWEQRLAWERLGEPLPFCGNEIESAFKTSPRTSVAGRRPLLVWTIAFQGRYSNQCLPCRGWGYVLWDADRIEQTGMDVRVREMMREM